jgi:DNA-binding CsgD family transcriptional regulator
MVVAVSRSLREMPLAIISREDELATLHAFLTGANGQARALVLEGEAGIGKSTLWLAGVERAHEQDSRVLLARPAEAERGLAHSGLGDLFGDALDDVLPSLAPPRRRALEVALLLEDASGDPVDRRALAAAVRDVLQLLGDRGPVLIAVDDVQWLDAASSSALAFAARRLEASDVRLLLARRLVAGAQPSGLEQALGAERIRRLSLGPLSVGAIHRFLRDRLGRAFPHQTLLRIHERSGGNPFFALELARALDADIDPLQPLPVPETLDELVRSRVSALPEPTREALALVAALGAPSEALLERAGVGADALEPAVAARVVEREDGTIRFTHPLLSSALYPESSAGRSSVHGRIARIVDDPVLRARHLALSTDGPDAEVAAALDDAARLAADRGASAMAAELAEQALRLTPPEGRDERHRRALTAARAEHAAGEWTRAQTIATDLLAEAEVGELRAEVLVFLAAIESLDRSIPLLEEALREAAARRALQSIIETELAWATRYRSGYRRACDHARAALQIADDLDDDALRINALDMLASHGAISGDAEAMAHATRAHVLASALGDPKLLKEATAVVADNLIAAMDVAAAREVLERTYRDWHARDEMWISHTLWSLSFVELAAGQWELAADCAKRARDIAVQYGLERPHDYVPTALIAVHRGQLELAREQSEQGLVVAEEQTGIHLPHFLAILGLVVLWSGSSAEAAVWLGKAERQAATLEWGEPTVRWWSGDYAEALLELGRIDDAVRVIDVWEADAARLGRGWTFAHVTRCRGLVAAARGEIEDAETILEQAVAQHEAADDPFGRARALLALGIAHRRTRQKRPAREAIQMALAGFEQLGAATWVEKARVELGSIGGRIREEGLTAAERRVADLVAEGRTNREVAAALFLGERTVASHLHHIYGKLGIRSRTELAVRLRAGEPT